MSATNPPQPRAGLPPALCTTSLCSPVASITALPDGGSNITMAQPAWKNAVGRFSGQGVGLAANVWNVFALLGGAGPGYSFVDSAGRAVYYSPRPTDNMTDPVGTPAFTTGLEELLQVRRRHVEKVVGPRGAPAGAKNRVDACSHTAHVSLTPPLLPGERHVFPFL